MPYQVGICDDELYQIKVNALFLKEIATNNGIALECHGFSEGKKLKKYLEQKSLDILFMDIDLKEESGINIAVEISKRYPDLVIIFITGHREFMEEAFDIEARGYLIKPLEMKKLESIMKKALLQISALKKLECDKELVITDENIKKKILCKDICYIQRQQYKCVIVTNKREYSVYESLSKLYLRLGDSFVRVNQSEVVNIKQVLGLCGNKVKLRNNREIFVGRTFQKNVVERLCTN